MRRSIKTDDEGFVLVLVLVLMVVVILLGVSVINTAIFESDMSANEGLHKMAFYQADGGADIGINLTFDNAVCVITHGGFLNSKPSGTKIEMSSNQMDFAAPTPVNQLVPPVSDTNRAAVYYPDQLPTTGQTGVTPHTNLLATGKAVYSPGSGLQMVSGYEALGAGAAAGGTHFAYTVFSQHIGERNSEANVTVGWQLSTILLNNASLSDCKEMYQ